VLAHVFERLRDAGLNVQETENVLFEGGEAAVARIHLDGAPSEATLAAIASGHPDVLDVRLLAV
jgi:D-3-phosphoglycerate dehydrogenase